MRIIIECPERILHLEAEYIYADCPFAQLQTSCSPAADYTLSPLETVVLLKVEHTLDEALAALGVQSSHFEPPDKVSEFSDQTPEI